MVQVFERWPLPQGKGADDFVEGFQLAQQQKRQQEQVAMQRQQAEAARRKEARSAIEDVIDKYVLPRGVPGGEDVSAQQAGQPTEQEAVGLDVNQLPPQAEAQNEVQRREALKNAIAMIDQNQDSSPQEKMFYKQRLLEKHENKARLSKAVDAYLSGHAGTPLEAEVYRQQVLSGGGLPKPDLATVDVEGEDGGIYRVTYDKQTQKELGRIQITPPQEAGAAKREAIVVGTMKNLAALRAARASGKDIVVTMPDGKKKNLADLTDNEMRAVAHQTASEDVAFQDALRSGTPGVGERQGLIDTTQGGRISLGPFGVSGGKAQGPARMTAEVPPQGQPLTGAAAQYAAEIADLKKKAVAVRNDPNSTQKQVEEAKATIDEIESRERTLGAVRGEQGVQGQAGAVPQFKEEVPSAQTKMTAQEFAHETSPAVTFGVEKGTPSVRQPRTQPKAAGAKPEYTLPQLDAMRKEYVATIQNPNTPPSVRSEVTENLAYIEELIRVKEAMPQAPGVADPGTIRGVIQDVGRALTGPQPPTPEKLRAEMDEALKFVERGYVGYEGVRRGALQYKKVSAEMIEAEKRKGKFYDEAMYNDAMRAVDDWAAQAMGRIALNKRYSPQEREAAHAWMDELVRRKREGAEPSTPREMVEMTESPEQTVTPKRADSTDTRRELTSRFGRLVRVLQEGELEPTTAATQMDELIRAYDAGWPEVRELVANALNNSYIEGLKQQGPLTGNAPVIEQMTRAYEAKEGAFRGGVPPGAGPPTGPPPTLESRRPPAPQMVPGRLKQDWAMPPEDTLGRRGLRRKTQ